MGGWTGCGAWEVELTRFGGHHFLTYLTDHDARWAHPQRLLGETSQLDLAGALETRLATSPVES